MRKIKKNDFVIKIVFFFLCMVNILLTLPILEKIIEKKNRNFQFLFGIFLGVLGFFFIPHMEGDYTRIISRIDFINPKVNINQPDLFLPFLLYFIGLFKLPKQLVGGISAFILYYYAFKAFYILVDDKLKNKKLIIIFIVYFFSFPIILYTGVRFSTGLAFFIYGIVLLAKNIHIKSMFYLLLSVCSHFSFILPILLIIFFSTIYKYENVKKFLIFNIILGLLLNPQILLYVATILNKLLKINLIADVYITGEWGSNFLENKSLLSCLVYYFQRIIQSSILLYYVFGMTYTNNRSLRRIICLLSGPLYFGLIYYMTPSFRYFSILLHLIIIETANLKIFKRKNNKLVNIYLLILSYIFINFSIDIYLQYKSFLISYSDISKLSLFNLIYKVLK